MVSLSDFITALQAEMAERGDGDVFFAWEGIERDGYLGESHPRNPFGSGIVRGDDGSIIIDAEGKERFV